MRALYASLLLIASAHAAEVIQGFDIQAETFTSQSSCEVKDENAGYSGAGYIDYGSAGSYIEWNDIVAATSGMYLLDVRYASSFDRPCSVIVNGITVGQLNCEATGDWDQWETERMIISLNSGMNTLRISAIGSGPNIDKIKATALVNPADHQFFKHAENYTALNGCSISTANSGYTGTGYIDYGNAETYTEWNNINVTADGLYSTTIRYAGYGDRPCSIRVNGISIGQLDFNSTGSWSSWANENIVLPLKNGANTVRITAIGAGPNIDSMNFSGLNNASIPSVSSFVKDAETAGTMSDCTASSSYSGYTGSGYADYGDAGSYVQWNNVAVSSSGTYGLFIRYATPFDRPCELRVNGIYIGDLNFSSTGDWTAWKSEYAAVPLNSGSNYIRITAIGAGPNIDKIEGAAQSIPTTLLAPSLSGFALQAEDATRQYGCSVGAGNSGYTGSGYADFGNTGTFIEWNGIEVDTAGTYSVFVSYATINDRPCSLIVNDNEIKSLAMASTGDWTNWAAECVTVELESGINSLRIATVGEGPNIDKIEAAKIDLTPAPQAYTQPEFIVAQAEDYTAQSGCAIGSSISGYTGSGYVDYGGTGTYIESLVSKIELKRRGSQVRFL